MCTDMCTGMSHTICPRAHVCAGNVCSHLYRRMCTHLYSMRSGMCAGIFTGRRTCMWTDMCMDIRRVMCIGMRFVGPKLPEAFWKEHGPKPHCVIRSPNAPIQFKL